MAKILRALISVSDKTGVIDFAKNLSELGIEILSTGGTANLLRENKIPVLEVSEFTGFPEIMDGRVKTLQPKIHGGILAIRDNPEHQAQMKQHGMAPIDLVVVNLYPFEIVPDSEGASYPQQINWGELTAVAKILRALISVSDKTGVIDFAKNLSELGIEILSTGGTANLLRENKIPVLEVSEFTGFPEIMDGRVKTLQPKIHGGILAIRDNPEHQAQMKQHGMAPIDLVVVNLYPFEATVARRAPFEEVVENIDIGGPSMLRAAAKNHAYVGVVVDPAD